MADGDAIEGLERSRATLQEYADSRGLILSSESPWPGYVPAEQQSGPVRHAIWSLAGKFPGAKLPVAWVEPGEAAVPGFGADIPSAALEDARVGGRSGCRDPGGRGRAREHHRGSRDRRADPAGHEDL